MLFNHDFYKPHTDQIYFSKYVDYDVREDKPLKFILVEDEYVIDSSDILETVDV